MRFAVLATCVVAASCGAQRPSPANLGPNSSIDAPYELESDADLDWLRMEYDALAENAPQRAPERKRLASEYARRVHDRLSATSKRRDLAFEALSNLLSLWTPTELSRPEHARKTLAPYLPPMRAVHRSFSRSGGEREVTLALAAMKLADPEHAPAYDAELKDLFAFADDLAVAQYGEGAQRARPIELLESALDSLAAPAVVDALINLYVERQKAIESQFRRTGADFQVLRAHGNGVLRTLWNIVRVHARARRLPDALPAIRAVVGIGDDSELRKRLQSALSPKATPSDWVFLAAAFDTGDANADDLLAAQNIAVEATLRFPRSAAVHVAAADAANKRGSAALALSLYERGLKLDPRQPEAATRVVQLYERRIATQASSGRPVAAQRDLQHLEAFQAASHNGDAAAGNRDLAGAYAAMGAGLLSQGDLEGARRYLAMSTEIRVTLGALESLGTMELKRDNFEAAISHFKRALALPAPDLSAEFDRNRVLRLAGEAYEGAGDLALAHKRYREALVGWNNLAEKGEFQAPFLSEAMIENGRLYWHLGHRDNALTLLESATDNDGDSSSTYAQVVSFLILHDEYSRALDTYARAMSSSAIDDYVKVYMSLWLVADARRRGQAEDEGALAFLASRRGPLWHEQLAQFATGTLSLQTITASATTNRRRAELLYYQAVLGQAESSPLQVDVLLRKVVARGMVLDFEHDMAKHWLGRDVVANPASR